MKSEQMETVSVSWREWLWLLLFMGYGLFSIAQQLPWIAALAGLWLLIRNPSGSVGLPEWRTYLGMLALFLIPAAISLIDSVAPERSLSTLVRFSGYALAGLALIRMRLTGAGWEWVQRGVFIFLVLISIDGLVQFVFGVNFAGRPPYADPDYGPRVTGALWIDYPHVLAILTPFLLDILVRHSSKHPLLWLGFPVFVAALVLSGSRASMLLFAAGVGLYALFLVPHVGKRRVIRFLLIAGLLGFSVFALAIASSNIGPRWSDALGLFSSDPATRDVAVSFRTLIWTEAVSQFQQHWINGVGLRAFATASLDVLANAPGLPEKPKGWHAHLIVLEMAVCLGVIGLVGYLVLYGWWLRWLWRAPRAALVPGVAVLLAWFPFASHLSAFSLRIGAMLWPMLALALMLSSAVPDEPTPQGEGVA